MMQDSSIKESCPNPRHSFGAASLSVCSDLFSAMDGMSLLILMDVRRFSLQYGRI